MTVINNNNGEEEEQPKRSRGRPKLVNPSEKTIKLIQKVAKTRNIELFDQEIADVLLAYGIIILRHLFAGKTFHIRGLGYLKPKWSDKVYFELDEKTGNMTLEQSGFNIRFKEDTKMYYRYYAKAKGTTTSTGGFKYHNNLFHIYNKFTAELFTTNNMSEVCREHNLSYDTITKAGETARFTKDGWTTICERCIPRYKGVTGTEIILPPGASHGFIEAKNRKQFKEAGGNIDDFLEIIERKEEEEENG